MLVHWKDKLSYISLSLSSEFYFSGITYLFDFYFAYILVFYAPIIVAGESSGNLPLRNCLECSVPEPYRSPDWALVPAKTGLRAEY